MVYGISLAHPAYPKRGCGTEEKSRNLHQATRRFSWITRRGMSPSGNTSTSTLFMAERIHSYSCVFLIFSPVVACSDPVDSRHQCLVSLDFFSLLSYLEWMVAIAYSRCLSGSSGSTRNQSKKLVQGTKIQKTSTLW